MVLVKSQHVGLDALVALAVAQPRQVGREGVLRIGENFVAEHPQLGMLHLQAVSAVAGRLGMSVQSVNAVLDAALPELVKVVAMEAGKLVEAKGGSASPGMNLDGKAARGESR